MYNVLTAAQVREAEKEALEKLKISEDALIEKAAGALCDEIIARKIKGKILIAAGGGNNGADGLSAARILYEKKFDISVLLASVNNSDNVRKRIGQLKSVGVKFIDKTEPLNNYSVIIDAIFGIGLSRKIEGDAAGIIDRLNEIENAFKIAVDIPSGLNADTGKTEGVCFVADLTVTFSACKIGMLINEAANCTGEIVVREIGIPVCNAEMYLCSNVEIKSKRRKRLTNKYDYGKVVIIGGSVNMPGAAAIAALSALSALKGGAGLVVTALPDCLKNAFSPAVLESMYCFLPSHNGNILFDAQALDGLMNKTSAIALGMGMPPDEELLKIILYLSKNFDGALILDAGALTILENRIEILKESKAKIMLTPHGGEFERIASRKKKGLSVHTRVKNLAAGINGIVLYKSAYSIISDGNKIFFNIFGTAALAKGGSGDALAGLVAALACTRTPVEAAYVASCVLGKAGEAAEKVLGSDGVLASEVVKFYAGVYRDCSAERSERHE